MPDLKGCKVAILATDGFEQVELTEPRKTLEEAGAQTTVVAPKSGEIRGWKFTEWGDQVKVDEPLDSASPDRFDALLLPGGAMNPDKLRMKPEAVQFVKSFFEAGKPVAARGSGRDARAQNRLVAFHQNRSARCRRGMDGQRSGDRRKPRFCAQARRHPRIQSRHGRALQQRHAESASRFALSGPTSSDQSRPSRCFAQSAHS